MEENFCSSEKIHRFTSTPKIPIGFGFLVTPFCFCSNVFKNVSSFDFALKRIFWLPYINKITLGFTIMFYIFDS